MASDTATADHSQPGQPDNFARRLDDLSDVAWTNGALAMKAAAVRHLMDLGLHDSARIVLAEPVPTRVPA